jgi:hypothetical protein
MEQFAIAVEVYGNVEQDPPNRIGGALRHSRKRKGLSSEKNSRFYQF